MMTYIKEIGYRKFKISHWGDQSKDIYRVVSVSVPRYLTVYKLFSKRWRHIKEFTALEDAESFIDNLYAEAEGIDKFLSDITTTIQFIHIRSEPELVCKEIVSKRELQESEVIEFLKEQGYEEKHIFELTIDIQRYSQPGTINAER